MLLLRVIFGLPISDQESELFYRLTKRRKPPSSLREIYIIAGRRSGKSFITALIAAFLACFGDFRAFIAAGETLAVLCLARDREQAKIVFRYVRAILNGVPALKVMVIAERADEIELASGVTVMVKSNDFRGVRGLTLAAVVADEICFWDAVGANPDREVIAAVRPAMVTIPSSKLIAISSPYATVGLMYEMHREHFGKEIDDVLVVQAPTELLNPTISQTVIQKEIDKDPEACRSEWLAEFRADISAAFSLEMIEACTLPGRQEFLPANFSYFAFVDPSGGRHDSYALAIAHRAGEKVVLDAIKATKPPFDPSEVTKEYSDFLKLFGVGSVVGDNYAGEWPVTEFAKNGIGYEQAEKNKSDLYLSLIPVMTSGAVELLDNEKLKTELRRLERRRGRSGKDSIDHPPRGSDDIANAVAGAIYLASRTGATLADFLEANRLAPERVFNRNRGGWLDQDASDALHPTDVPLDNSRRGGGWEL
jgi:hypothetical protein